MNKYLIAIDLDGTILPNLYGLDDFNVEAFNKIRAQGHDIIITTGRPFRSSFFVYYKFKLDTPIINYNGQLIFNPRDTKYDVYSITMPKEELIDIYNHEKEHYELFFCEVFDEIYANKYDEFSLPIMHHNQMSTLHIGDLNELLKTGIHGSLILAKDGHGQDIVDYVKDNFKDIDARIWSWGPYKEIVEVFLIEANKGTALKKVKKDLGYDFEHTIVCADSINDFELMEEGATRIAPSNADNRIKSMANVVLDEPCEEDAVAKYLLKFLKIGEEDGN